MDIARRLKPGHMQLLIHIAETGQLQRAAQLCAMSQPAASRILAEIERQMGSPLFDRHPKGATPTELGSVVIRHAKLVLQELDDLEIGVARHTTGEVGRVRVGAVTGPAVGSLIPAVQRIKAQTPLVEMTIEVGPSTELVRGLAEGRFDFVIARLPPDYDSRDFRMHPARSEEVVLVVRPNHPLAGGHGANLAETRSYEWVMQDIGSPIRQAVEAAFHTCGLETPERVTNSSSLLIMLAMLHGTDVIAPQSREVFEMLVSTEPGPPVAMVDLNAPISVSPCFIIRNRHTRLSASAQRLFQEILEQL